MGKSAGKWIKTVLFGKKPSKSKNIVLDIKTSDKNPVEDVVIEPPVISDPCLLTERGSDNLELPEGTAGSPCDTTVLSSVPQTDNALQEQAATIAQAAFRGYLARRAFRALKGIIRLQALIRGHLVRRQAVATFHCMRAIVRIQALARKADAGTTLFSGTEKLATNTFIHKLLVSLPTALPLCLKYDMTEPNSAWNWLERWSTSRFWETSALSKKVMKGRPQKNQAGAQVVEPEVGKSRRTTRKVPTDLEEQSRNELERVKRNLRKISASAAAAFEKSDGKVEKLQQPLQSVKMETNAAPSDVSKEEKAISSENLVDSHVDKVDVHGSPLRTATDAPVHVISESHSLENGLQIQNSATLDDELRCKEEQSGKEYHETRKRRSLPAMQESAANASQNSRSVPSYMAATESAKAKLRAQGSGKLDEDGADYGITRRHSLPVSINSKLSSSSPRIQKQVQANGKGGSKSNKSLIASRDEKVVLPGWRR